MDIVETLFYGDSLWMLWGGSVALFSLTFEVGYRLGQSAKNSVDETTKLWIATVDGAILAMLELLLGFSFVMAQQRFEARRHLVVAEANAIGTAYLRAQLLPETHRQEVSKLLRDYVDSRLPKDFHKRKLTEIVRGVVALSDELRDQLWVHAVKIVKKNDSPATALFVGALNELIDIHGERLGQLYNRVPASILLLIYVFSDAALLTTGFGSGLGNRRCFLPMTSMIVHLAVFVFVIVDLDRPQRGFIRVSQQSMIDLQKKLNADSAPAQAGSNLGRPR